MLQYYVIRDSPVQTMLYSLATCCLTVIIRVIVRRLPNYKLCLKLPVRLGLVGCVLVRYLLIGIPSSGCFRTYCVGAWKRLAMEMIRIAS